VTAPRPRVVIAPDKFKGSLSAADVAAALSSGIAAKRADAEIECLPVADGGDGTVDAAVAAGYSRIAVGTVGPTGEPVATSYAMRDRTAVVELASSVGLGRLPEGRPRPLTASTYGLGLVVDEAVRIGATTVVVGLGGSASSDGGAGMLQALGCRLVGEDGAELPRGGGALSQVVALDRAAAVERLAGVSLVAMVDVDNPLLGPRGAATVFAPQKGATEADVAVLEHALGRWAALLARVTGRDLASAPGAGAAGGTGLALLAVLGAHLRPGIDVVLDLTRFDQAVRGARLVVTGEGSLDEQSLGGKAPVGVARAARTADPTTRVVAVAGRSLLDSERLGHAGIDAVYALSEIEPDPARSIACAADLLTRVGGQIAEDWLA
jgi:glycerate 2-kinase